MIYCLEGHEIEPFVLLPLMTIDLTVLHVLVRYGDVVRELDHSVGAILDTVQRLGLAADTLAVFSSDNGAATYEKTGGNISILIQHLLYCFSLFS